MKFEECVTECCKTPELIRQYDRLQGSQLSRVLVKDTRPPIVRMIDESTGYQSVLDYRVHEEFRGFISFIFEFIWLPLVIEEINKGGIK